MPVATGAKSDATAVRPFTVDIPRGGTGGPARADSGDPLARGGASRRSVPGRAVATVQELARYWASEYDWRRVEAKLNALPQFMTEIRWAGRPLHSRAFEA
jgi:hypothetical protein